MKPLARNCASRSGPATPASNVASCESGSRFSRRRSRVMTMASDGLSPALGVKWPTTLVAPPTGIAIARMSRAQAKTSLTSSSVSRKGDAVDNGADASETNAQPVFETLTNTRPQPRLRVMVDEAMLGQARGTHLGKDRSERRIARRRRITDAFAQKIARAVG